MRRQGPRTAPTRIRWPCASGWPMLPRCWGQWSSHRTRSGSSPPARRPTRLPRGAFSRSDRASPGAVGNTAASAPRACCARLRRGRQGHGRAGLADCGPRGRLACVGPEPRGVPRRCGAHAISPRAWRELEEEHGHGDNVRHALLGFLERAGRRRRLAWLRQSAGRARNADGTARPEGFETVIVNGHPKRFSAEVAEFLLGGHAGQTAPSHA